MIRFAPSLHDIPAAATHGGWHTDANPWERGASQMMRAHVVGYAEDEKGRPRWQVETRDGAYYDQVEILAPSGYTAAPRAGDNVEGMLWTLNGDHTQVVFMPMGDSANWQKLPAGHAGISQPENPDHHINFDGEGNITINAPGKAVTIENAETVTVNATSGVTLKAQSITIDGDLTINGNITHDGNMTTSGVHVDSTGGHPA